MVEQDSIKITEDEAALYDRQIRLWGLDAQKRLRAARILLIGIGGLGAEIAKNIVLAGVRSLTLLDHNMVTVEDTTSQFLVDRSHIDHNRAVCSQHRTQLLNPMVEVKVETESSTSKSEQFFCSFDVVCATCCTLDELLRLDDICTRNNIAFYAGDVFGFYGFMFANLHVHDYAEEVPESHSSSQSGEPPAKKQHLDESKKTVKKSSTFTQLKNVIAVDWTLEANAKKLKQTPKTYFIMRVLLEFRSKEGRDPDTSHVESDRDKLQELARGLAQSMGIPTDFISSDFHLHCVASLSPVCAITGGVLAQEIIKAVSKHDTPHNNFFFYNGVEGSGLVDKIG